MTYQTPSCSYCPGTIRACRQGEGELRGPAFCPSKVDPGGIAKAWESSSEPFNMRVARAAAQVEAEGYCRWTRVEEVCQFAKKMGFRKVGIAMCISFVDLGHVLSAILESHGLEVASVACKHGGVPKERIGLKDEDKVNPGNFEAMCNPVSQAELLNRAGCELNVILGLCVGHDSLFARHSAGLVTTLVAKDRVLAHNPVGALQLADSYFSRVWGPHKPAKLPFKPAEGRKRT
ncbi:MAG: DUF1847 domain-containing protein [Betaproteobacteria bacterium]|nr:DUF1847 domain-containing protein [Betaproteobacteria bacterium]MBI2960757.1 DUF1847 domain-containing protein [Betaproteobacteria bacterium]